MATVQGSSSGAGMVIYACGDCGQRCSSHTKLRAHQDNFDHGPYKFRMRVSWYVLCNDCGRSFMEPMALLSHQRAKMHGFYGTVPEEKKLMSGVRKIRMCPVTGCVESFRKVNLLYKHLQNKHPNINWSVPPHLQGNPTTHTPPPDTLNVSAPNTAVQDTSTTSIPAGHRQDQPTKQTKKAAKIPPKPATTYSCIVFHCSSVFSNPEELHNHEVQAHNLPTERQISQRYKIHCSVNGCSSSHWSKKDHRRHMKSVHMESYRCLDCARDFKTATGLSMHLNAKIHAVRPTVLEVPPNTCPLCNKTFKTAAALRSHSQSRKHKPITENLACIHPGCKKKFNSPSAMLLHLESGSCSPGINIFAVNKVIMENDPTGIITDLDAKQKLEAWRKAQRSLMDREKENIQSIPGDGGDRNSHEILTDLLESDDDDGVHIFTPNTFDSVSGGVSVSISGEMTPESYMYTPLQSDRGGIMTPTSLLGGPNPTALTAELILVENMISRPSRKYICPLCPKTKRSFRSQADLERHLSSAAHAPKIFHCPTSLLDEFELFSGNPKKKNHFKMFTTLSGLAQHLEAESCKGGKDTFEKVIKFVETRMRDMGFEGRLLTSAK